MRDSGKDRCDEIKLRKLIDFPFFNQEDLREINRHSIISNDLENGVENNE
jgi:hypothetical protein